MKYIRTKDGVYELEHDGWLTKRTKPKHVEMLVSIDEEHYEMRKIIHKKEIGKKYWETEIIKQADTIEELCDAFVDTSELRGTNTGGWLYDEFDTKNKCLIYYEHDERKAMSLNEFDDLSKIYGAIWTDKGLIYVAKINDKGDLELL